MVVKCWRGVKERGGVEGRKGRLERNKEEEENEKEKKKKEKKRMEWE